MAVEIILDLQGHCVETAAKHEYKRLMDRVFTEDVLGDSEAYIEEKIGLLSDFLHAADFSALRASDEQLAGITGGSARLYRSEKGTLCLISSESSRNFYM